MKSTRFNILLTAVLAVLALVFLNVAYYIIIRVVPEPLVGMATISVIYAMVGSMIFILRRGKASNDQV